MRRHLPLTGIVLLAALLRLGGLGSRSLWLDEGAEYDVVRGSLGHVFERIANASRRRRRCPICYEWAVQRRCIGTERVALPPAVRAAPGARW